MKKKSIAECADYLTHVNKHKCLHSKGTIEIIETDEGGEGKVDITVSGEFLQFRPGKEPIKWLAHTKCADGAFLLFTDAGIELHIVELKSNLNSAQWNKAQTQMEGMLLNALALKGILNTEDFVKVICYIAYKHDSISPSQTATLVGLKLGVGKNISPIAPSTWITETITLLNNFKAKVIKIQRDRDGNGAYALT